MRITGCQAGLVRVPLRRHFTTALRSVDAVTSVLVRLDADDGRVGFGEAPPTPQVTGETVGSILGALQWLSPAVRGSDPADDEVFARIDRALPHNTSAKAAVDIAVHDLRAQAAGVPVATQLGGEPGELTTDITISIDTPQAMAAAAREAVAEGFGVLKVKLGATPDDDVARLVAVRDAAGNVPLIRADANQAWTAQQAVRVLGMLADAEVNLELVEQPVPAADLAGLAFVTAHSEVPVLADESVFSLADAERVIGERAADLINVKLMKAGGLTGGRRIVELATSHDVGVLVGSMLETRLAVTAAAHLATAARGPVPDLDGPLLCTSDPVHGGATFAGPQISVGAAAGLGITGVEGVEWHPV